MSKLIIGIVAAAGTTLAVTMAQLPVAKVTLHVIGDDGHNLSGMNAEVTFLNPVHKPGSWGSSDTFSRSGKTDANGLFIAEEKAGFEIHYGASSTDYYRSLGRFDFKTEKDGRYQPWNPIFDVTLKKIVNPIPMYAKRLETKFPVEAWAVGFDLAESDWVIPYGHGKVSDMVFEINRAIRGAREFDAALKLTFFNKGDGIYAVPIESQNMASELRLPHEASQSGYAAERIWQFGSNETKSNEDRQKQSYFYRVRTVLDSSGHVVTALYGKIHGDIKFYVGTKAPKPGLGFTYYLNPTPNDRNVEFDPKRNLFTNLKDEERVTAP
jgi:hypothetical protein